MVLRNGDEQMPISMNAIAVGFGLVLCLGIVLAFLGSAYNIYVLFAFGSALAGFAIFLGFIFLRYWKAGKVIW